MKIKIDRVDRDVFLISFIACMQHNRYRPPDLAFPIELNTRAATYLAVRRHPRDPTALYLRCYRKNAVLGIAAMARSPFDETALGIPVGRLQSIEAEEFEAAQSLVQAIEDGAHQLGIKLLLARIHPSSMALPALVERGWAVYGANVLYAGVPQETSFPDEVESSSSPEEVHQAAQLVGHCFVDTHLSRDKLLERDRCALIYESWVRAEAERGAQLLFIRRSGQWIGLGVCRDNPTAHEYLNIDIWHLHLFAVDPRQQGQGIGTMIAQAVFSLARDRGATLVQTGVDTAHLAAQRIYSRLGLFPAGSSLVLHRWL